MTKAKMMFNKAFSLILGIVFCTAGAIAGTSSLSGVLSKSGGDSYLQLTANGPEYLIVTNNTAVTEALNRMSSGDYVQIEGSLIASSNKVQVDSLDFVGLQRLLGLWYSGTSLLNFTTFNSLNILSLMGDSSTTVLPSNTQILYSMSPYAGNQWALFLSSKVDTVFTTIEFKEKGATLHVYDTDTGAEKGSLFLQRWKP